MQRAGSVSKIMTDNEARHRSSGDPAATAVSDLDLRSRSHDLIRTFKGFVPLSSGLSPFIESFEVADVKFILKTEHKYNKSYAPSQATVAGCLNCSYRVVTNGSAPGLCRTLSTF